MNIIGQFNNDIMENCFFTEREGQEPHQQNPFLCVNPAMLECDGVETRLEPPLNLPRRKILNGLEDDNYYGGLQEDIDNAESINSVLNEFTTGIVDGETDATVQKTIVISPDNGTDKNFSIPSLSNMINDAAGFEYQSSMPFNIANESQDIEDKPLDENNTEAIKEDKSKRVLDRKRFADVSKVALQRLDDVMYSVSS